MAGRHPLRQPEPGPQITTLFTANLSTDDARLARERHALRQGGNSAERSARPQCWVADETHPTNWPNACFQSRRLERWCQALVGGRLLARDITRLVCLDMGVK